jgi:hypothetical protein
VIEGCAIGGATVGLFKIIQGSPVGMKKMTLSNPCMEVEVPAEKSIIPCMESQITRKAGKILNHSLLDMCWLWQILNRG